MATETEHPVDAVDAALDQVGLPHEEATPEERATLDPPEAEAQPEDAPEAQSAPEARPDLLKQAEDVRVSAEKQAAADADADATAPDPAKAAGADRLTEEQLATPKEYQGRRQAHRWDTLRQGYQAQEARADKAEQMLEQARPIVERMVSIDQWMQSAGVTNDQAESLMQVAHAVNAGTPETLAWARAEALSLVQSIDASLGFVGGDSPDVVGRYPDLRDAVESGEISEAYAEQLALARVREQSHQHSAAQMQQMQQMQASEQAAAAERNAGAAEVNALDAELARTVPGYTTHIKPVLRAQIGEIVNRAEPRNWAGLIRSQVQTMQAMAGAPMQASPNVATPMHAPPMHAPARHGEFLRPSAPMSHMPRASVADARTAYDATEIALQNAGLGGHPAGVFQSL